MSKAWLFGSCGTSLTGLKGVFWESGLREVEGIGWDEIKDYFESQVEGFKFNMGAWELVKVSEQVSRKEEVFKDH